ncbi:MAG: LPS assembly lipoprotein LptE [Methylophilaceae bacterium]
MKKIAQHYLPLKIIGLLLMCATLAACGFQLRGAANLSFKSIFVQGNTLSISKELNKAFKLNGIQLASKVEDAELQLELLNESSEKRILTLSGNGTVREYELIYIMTFRARDPAQETWGAPQSVQSRRDFSYNDNELLGKADEEATLNADMRSDAVREIIRRLSAIKVTPK